jgi:hypothetical protein
MPILAWQCSHRWINVPLNVLVGIGFTTI